MLMIAAAVYTEWLVSRLYRALGSSRYIDYMGCLREA